MKTRFHDRYCPKQVSIAFAILLSIVLIPLIVGAEQAQPRIESTRLERIRLTQAELDFIEEHPVLRVAFDIDWPPVEFADKESGMDGIATDYLAHISTLLGVQFEPAPPMTWQEMLDAVKAGELDMFSAIAPTEQRAEWLGFTESYASFPIVIVTNMNVPYIGSIDDLAGKVVAVVNGYATHDLLTANHQAIKALPAENMKDALMAVIEGKAFAFIGSLATVSHVIRREGFSTLKVSGETPYRYQITMAARHQDAVLVNMLQKALSAIPQQERNDIYSARISVTVERLTDYSLVWKVSAGACIIVALILCWNRRLRQMAHELTVAHDAAKRANAAKSTFLANMSHELRTPLNAILGFSQLSLREAGVSDQLRDNLETINRSGTHLLTLINDVLELSKIEAGQIELQSTAFDLYELLLGLEEMFRLHAGQKGLRLIFDHPPDLPQYVRTDQNKLRQILINILGNAIKFTGEGGVTLRVSRQYSVTSIQSPVSSIQYPVSSQQSAVSSQQSAVTSIQFQIEDTGAGIAAEEVEHVFDAFVQTAAGRQSQQGTGLGMPISQKFVRMMGGELTVRSELGQGSVSIFEIPVDVVQAGDIAVSRRIKRVVGLEAGQQTFRLLIVEDVPDNRALLVKLLAGISTSDAGFDIREAVNGQEAVEIWQRWQPHLIWMDIRLPVMDGCEATRLIKSQASTRQPQSHPIIIALTASAFGDDRRQVFDAGCDNFVRKPFRESEIFDILATYLGVRFVYEESPAPSPVSERRLARDTVWKDDVAKHIRTQLTPEAFAQLPKEWLKQLERGAEEIDIRLLSAVIEQIREQRPAIADALELLVENFAYDEMLALLHQQKTI